MRRITLAVVAVLLAVPTLAQAKAGIEFDNAIQTQRPGQPQGFRAFVARAVSGPAGNELEVLKGVRPHVTFTDARTGRVIRARTSRTGSAGVARGTVVFPDRGPWSAAVEAGGEIVLDQGQPFTLAPPAAAHERADAGRPAAWLLSFPAAALAAVGIWLLRRHPREVGA